MAKYIDLEKAIAEIDKGELLVGNNAEWAKDILLRMPTAEVVEVVRCKDCRHANDCGTICHYGVGRDVKPDHFCGYGEKKEEDI